MCDSARVCVSVSAGSPVEVRGHPRSWFSPFTYMCSRDQTQVVRHGGRSLYPKPSGFPDKDVSYGLGGYRTLVSAPHIKPNTTNGRMCLRSVVWWRKLSPSLAVVSCILGAVTTPHIFSHSDKVEAVQKAALSVSEVNELSDVQCQTLS